MPPVATEPKPTAPGNASAEAHGTRPNKVGIMDGICILIIRELRYFNIKTQAHYSRAGRLIEIGDIAQ